METIEFYDGEETRPVVDGSDRYESSIFKEQIFKALSTIGDIIKNGTKKQKETKENKNK
jgi:hypothetical protein